MISLKNEIKYEQNWNTYEHNLIQKISIKPYQLASES